MAISRQTLSFHLAHLGVLCTHARKQSPTHCYSRFTATCFELKSLRQESCIMHHQSLSSSSSSSTTTTTHHNSQYKMTLLCGTLHFTQVRCPFATHKTAGTSHDPKSQRHQHCHGQSSSQSPLHCYPFGGRFFLSPEKERKKSRTPLEPQKKGHK